MKEVISIFTESRGDDESSLRVQIEELARQFPEFARIDKGKAEIAALQISADDERVYKLLRFAQDLGSELFDKICRGSCIRVVHRKIYQPEELDGCPYLWKCDAGKSYLGEVDYPLSLDVRGVPALAGKPRQKARMFGTPEPVHSSFFVVRGKDKEKLENAGLRGLELYPVVFNRSRSLATEDRLWAVWSDLVLPSMKNLFSTDAGEIGFADVVTDRSRNAGPTKGFRSNGEIHYQKEKIEAFGEFDVALMREPLKIHGTLPPRPIFSQRFRRFVIDELGVPFGGVPVCIDDDDVIPWEGPYPSKWAHLNRRPEWLEKLQNEVSKGGRGGR